MSHIINFIKDNDKGCFVHRLGYKLAHIIYKTYYSLAYDNVKTILNDVDCIYKNIEISLALVSKIPNIWFAYKDYYGRPFNLPTDNSKLANQIEKKWTLCSSYTIIVLLLKWCNTGVDFASKDGTLFYNECKKFVCNYDEYSPTNPYNLLPELLTTIEKNITQKYKCTCCFDNFTKIYDGYGIVRGRPDLLCITEVMTYNTNYINIIDTKFKNLAQNLKWREGKSYMVDLYTIPEYLIRVILQQFINRHSTNSLFTRQQDNRMLIHEGKYLALPTEELPTDAKILYPIKCFLCDGDSKEFDFVTGCVKTSNIAPTNPICHHCKYIIMKYKKPIKMKRFINTFRHYNCVIFCTVNILPRDVINFIIQIYWRFNH